MNSKKELRKEVLKKRDALSYEERSEKSCLIARRIISHPIFQNANIILLFASFRSEVDTTEIFAEAMRTDKKVYFPRVHGDEMEFYQVENETDFEKGYWGIREPKLEVCKKYKPHPKQGICVIMPGAVFDTEGNRIGYGGGYYDKYLQWLEYKLNREDAFIRPSIYKMAIGFECQMVEVGFIQREEHDIRIDCIITEDRIIYNKTDINNEK